MEKRGEQQDTADLACHHPSYSETEENTIQLVALFTGVFCNGDLAAWMVQSYYGAMFSMQTRPEFRRRGYGLHLARRLTQTVRQRGYIPYVVIRPENEASKSLYTKLGFKQNFQTVRVIFRPHGYNEKLDIPQEPDGPLQELQEVLPTIQDEKEEIDQ